MKTPFGHRSISARVFHFFRVGILLAALPQPATASSVAFVDLANCGHLILQNPISIAGTNTGIANTGPCASPGATASGDASLVTGDIDLYLTSIVGRGLLGSAYLDDFLTFHVAGGGSAQVALTMAGDWGGTADSGFSVSFALALGSMPYHEEHGYATDYDDGISHSFSSTTSGGLVNGTYLYNTTWTVSDGQRLEFFAGLKADVSGNASVYINDPLTITLPAGVTFTSDSGATYAPQDTAPSAVPEPATWLLLGSGLASKDARRRIKRVVF